MEQNISSIKSKIINVDELFKLVDLHKSSYDKLSKLEKHSQDLSTKLAQNSGKFELEKRALMQIISTQKSKLEKAIQQTDFLNAKLSSVEALNFQLKSLIEQQKVDLSTTKSTKSKRF